MTKRDFLAALRDPIMAEAKIRLRNLRKELKAVGWGLQYRYDKNQEVFDFIMHPTVDNYTNADAFNTLFIIEDMTNTQYKSRLHDDGTIHGWFEINYDN